MSECLTKPLVHEFSGCLVENPSCNFATRLGFSYLCEHPYHKEFHNSKITQLDPIELNNRYNKLRDSRKIEYLEEERRGH